MLLVEGQNQSMAIKCVVSTDRRTGVLSLELTAVARCLPPPPHLSTRPALRGDCISCSGVTIKDLIIDGNRPLMLRMPMGEALVELGNSNNQHVETCKLYEPR